MPNLFDLNSPVMLFLKKAANLMLLNLLWLVCCIPVITIGAATGAMYRVCLQLISDDDPGIFRAFFYALREDWRKSTGVFLLIILAGAVAVLDYFVIAKGSAQIPSLLRVMAAIPILLYLMAGGYVFPLHAKFENTIGNIIRNALFLSLRHIFCTILVFIMNSLPIIVLFLSEQLFWQLSIVWVMIGMAWMGYLKMKLLDRFVFRKLITAEQDAGK